MRILSLALMATTLGPAAYAVPVAVVLNPAFVSEPSKEALAFDKASTCTINVVGLQDARRDPELIGVLGNKAVKSPPDSQAWLRAIVGDLGKRGYAVKFDDAAAPANAISVKVTLHTVWIDAVQANKTASVVMMVEATRPDGTSLSKPVRGSVALVNWINGDGELQDAVNLAFGKALDRMAIELRPLCA